MASQFSQAAVIGTGMMGPGIALTLALGGVRATILSRTAEGAVRGLEAARTQGGVLEANGIRTADEIAAALALIEASADFDGVIAAADLVVESAPEDMTFKQDLFARMDRLTRPDAVLASNTSGLSITAIAARCAHPERVITTHFWNPPHLIPLVEIVHGELTSPAVGEALRALFAACGKVPVMVKKDRPGQLGNRLQMALVREAIHIVAEGIADVDAVDTVAKNGFGLRLPAYGIFEHQDMVGLDLGMAVLDYVSRDLAAGQGTPDFAREMMARGELGAKAGKGFYDWSVKSAAEVKSRRDAFVLEVLRYRRQGGTGGPSGG
jgi:3-hydroxybutyryl-CoA dehydrogenase